MRAYEVIHAKRDGRAIPAGDLAALVDGFTRGEIPDYQMSAFCMAVFFRGMDDAEVAALTGAMLRSGDVLDLSDVPGAKVDKHSTGGVGDKVSLALARGKHDIQVPEDVAAGARRALERMIAVPRDA